MDRVDEILEGYRTFTALAAEVNTPGGSGIMSRYDASPSSSTTERRAATPAALSSLSPTPETLDAYAPPQNQQRPQQRQRFGETGEGERTRGGEELGSGRGGTFRGQGVPYIDPASDPVMMDALRLLFAKEGNYVQDLVSSRRRINYYLFKRGNGISVGMSVLLSLFFTPRWSVSDTSSF